MVQRCASALLAGALVCLGVGANSCRAQALRADTITITGTVKPAASTAEEAATVLANRVPYKIVNDAKGKTVARDAAGKKAEIRGTVSERNGVKWLTVSWCALVE